MGKFEVISWYLFFILMFIFMLRKWILFSKVVTKDKSLLKDGVTIKDLERTRKIFLIGLPVVIILFFILERYFSSTVIKNIFLVFIVFLGIPGVIYAKLKKKQSQENKK